MRPRSHGDAFDGRSTRLQYAKARLAADPVSIGPFNGECDGLRLAALSVDVEASNCSCQFVGDEDEDDRDAVKHGEGPTSSMRLNKGIDEDDDDDDDDDALGMLKLHW